MLTRIVKLQGWVLFFYVGAIFAASDQRPVPNARHLEQTLASIAERCGGRLGIAAVHVESGREVSVSGNQPLPLYSVVKLPLAIMVLKDVESAKIQLDQKVLVRREDVAPGSPGNAERWEKAPMNVTVRELLEFALVDSDNTSADKLFDLIGGPAALERRMHALGFGSFKVGTSMKEMGRHAVHPNIATAQGTVQLLVALQKGNVLKLKERTILFDMMSRARTGQKRIVAGVPSGTEVLHKTGTGSNEVNDVGLITLPRNHGRIALAIMISESKLTTSDQERVVAEAARTIYEAWE